MLTRIFFCCFVLLSLVSKTQANDTPRRPLIDFFLEPLTNIPGDLKAGLIDDQNHPNLVTLSIALATTAGAISANKTQEQPFGTFSDGSSLHFLSGWVSNSGMIYSVTTPLGFYLLNEYDIADQLVETLALTSATVFPLKLLVSRRGPSPRNNQSFPSGHTAIAFATATSLAYNCPWYVGVPALMVAGAIGVARMDLHYHFLSDVIVGAGIGAFYASSVWLHHRQKNHSTAVSWVPWMTPSSLGVTVVGF